MWSPRSGAYFGKNGEGSPYIIPGPPFLGFPPEELETHAVSNHHYFSISFVAECKMSDFQDKTNEIVACALANQANDEIITIFCGNPGAGKSTLLNSLARKLIFKSGISIGSGMKTVVQVDRGIDGQLYGDTPGLDDIHIRAAAAAEINKILRCYGRIRLCFVIASSMGRISPADKAMIEVILNALPPSNDMFSIIVNQVGERVAEKLNERKEMQKLLSALASENHSTSHVHIVLKEEHADGASNCMLNDETIENLQRIVRTMPVMSYNVEEVKDIKHDALEALRESFSKQVENIQKENREQVNTLTRKHDAAIERMNVDARNQVEEIERRMNATHANMQASCQHELTTAREQVNTLTRRYDSAIVEFERRTKAMQESHQQQLTTARRRDDKIRVNVGRIEAHPWRIFIEECEPDYDYWNCSWRMTNNGWKQHMDFKGFKYPQPGTVRVAVGYETNIWLSFIVISNQDEEYWSRSDCMTNQGWLKKFEFYAYQSPQPGITIIPGGS
jgi:GTPase Era involved in 16S rRNA processing